MSDTETSHSYRNANVTDYDAQAQAFLDRFGIKFRATLSDSKTPAWKAEGERSGHHYRVTLSKGERETNEVWPATGRRLTFDFWASIADADKGIETVTPYDVLACISSDSYCPATFEEWAGELGAVTDSIKALQTYRRCSAFAKRLQAFFTKEEIEALREIQ